MHFLDFSGGVNWWTTGFGIVALIALAFFLSTLFDTVPQAHVVLLTAFGKYRRILHSGFNLKAPWERIDECLSLQNQTIELKFQAITKDQANIRFVMMILYAVAAQDDETIKKAVFCFIDDASFQTALKRTIDGSIRQYVATVKQGDILGMRSEIVEHTKQNIDKVVLEWGYAVHDIQITDMLFDDSVSESMSRVVASLNLRTAAENEGAALLIKRTADANAEAAFKTIGAEAEKKAAALRGEGLALFRENIARGMKEAASDLKEAGVDASFLLFLEYTDALKYVADHSTGKVIFMDSSPEAPQRILAGVMGAMEAKS
jgi:regulator of protease activity HflC (stomatin/prohibitin superfamily)